PAGIGPFASIVPFTVTPAPRTCDPESLKVPTLTSAPPPTAQPGATAPPTGAGTPRVVTRQIETTDSGGAPLSLLVIPCAAGLLGGGLYLDEQRRSRDDERAPDDETGADTGPRFVVPSDEDADLEAELRSRDDLRRPDPPPSEVM